MSYRKGVTIVEIMIIVAIIALLATVAVPHLLNARLANNELAAITGLKTIASASHKFKATHSSYPADLAALGGLDVPLIDKVLASGTKQGYVFNLTGTDAGFSATAQPDSQGVTGNRYFFVDTTDVITYANSTANANSTVLN